MARVGFALKWVLVRGVKWVWLRDLGHWSSPPVPRFPSLSKEDNLTDFPAGDAVKGMYLAHARHKIRIEMTAWPMQCVRDGKQCRRCCNTEFEARREWPIQKPGPSPCSFAKLCSSNSGF